MSTHNIGFYEEISKISLNHHQICILSLPLQYCMVLSFRTDRSGQTVQTQIRLHLHPLEALLYLSRVMRKPTFWFSTWSDTKQAVQLKKMARGLKFPI